MATKRSTSCCSWTPRAPRGYWNCAARKRYEIRRCLERAVAGNWTAAKLWYCAPGIMYGDMIARFVAPETLRHVLLPSVARLLQSCGGDAISVEHRDPSLLPDYLQLPKLRGARLPHHWPLEARVEGLRGKGILMLSAQDARRVAGELRVLVTLQAQGESPREAWAHLLREQEEIKACWEQAGVS